MAGYSLTSRFKVPVPEEGNEDWLDLLTQWAELMDVMFTVLANKDYVISGLVVSTSTSNLNFSYTSGIASVNGVEVPITSSSGSLTASTFNWVYVQGGVVKVSTYPPSGASYVPLATIFTSSTASVGNADLRASPPNLNGININPAQVNPTEDITLPSGKRLVHSDTNVGSNIIMFPDAQRVSVVNWGNQAGAIVWSEINLSSYVSANAKFAILNLRLATLNANYDGWAILEVKTNSSDTDYVVMVADHGHMAAAPLNPSVSGTSNQVTLAIDTSKKFRVRTLVDNLGGTGVYYAFVQLLGYVE